MSAKNYLSLQELTKLWRVCMADLENFDYSHLPNEVTTRPRQILWHLLNEANEIPICQRDGCNNKVKWDRNDAMYRTFCSLKCSNNDENVLKKKQETSMKNYGVKNPMQSPKVREKAKQILLERYGVDNVFKSEMHRKQARETCIKRHGATPLELAHRSLLEKYGVRSPFELKEIQEQIRRTVKEKYGVISTLQLPEIEEKIRQTKFEKYGTEHHQQRHFSDKTKEILFNQENLIEFMKNKSARQASIELGIDVDTMKKYIQEYNIVDYLRTGKSYLESEMSEFLKTNGIEFIQNTRKMIPPLELDFYIAEHDLAIEMNGTYWHRDEFLIESRGMTADEYHQMKTDMCASKGIRLIHVAEQDWCESRDEVCRKILDMLVI